MPFAGLFAPENFRLVENMIRRKRWLSVLCAMAVMLASFGGWWSEYSIGSAATYWVYVEDYFQGERFDSTGRSYSSTNPVSIESFFQVQSGIDKTPGKIHEGKVLTSYNQGTVTPLENGAGRAVLNRYFSEANCTVTYVDRVRIGPRAGDTLGSTNVIVPCGRAISGNDLTTTHAGFFHSRNGYDDTYKYTATIYREFDPTSTTVYYNYQGGVGGSVSVEEFYYGSAIRLRKNTSTKSQTINIHSTAEEDSSVTKTIQTSSTFLGWANSAGGSVLYNDEANAGMVVDEPYRSLWLYAVWDNEEITPPEPAERAGYEFLGWSTNPNAVTGSTTFAATDDMELYPVWSAEERTWQMEYYIENLNGEYELTDSETHGGTVDSEVSLDVSQNQDEYTGFTLNEDKSVLSGVVPAEGELVLKAYYSRNRYSLNYDANGGEKTGGEQGWTTEKKFDETVKLLSPGVRRTGYRFNGWSETPEGGENILAPGSDFTVPAQDVTLYANWTPISYEVAFDGNGAGGTAEAIGSLTTEYDREITLPECNYTKTGYSFAGWNTKADGSGSLYGAGAKVKNLLTSQGKVTLYAQWRIRTYHVSYHTNHTEAMLISNANAIPDTEFQYGSEVRASGSVYKALGYKMKGWNTKADGTGISIALGEKINGKIECNDDIVLYAVWDREPDTAFKIELYTTSEGTTESQVTTLTLSGVTEEKICDAVQRIYEEELDGESVDFFYEGYEVVNTEAMEQTIAGDGSTTIKLQLKERRCELSFRYFADGQEIQLEPVDLAYMEPCVLPEKIGEQAAIARYITAKQESYCPGEEIRLRRNKVLYLQQAIKLEGNSGQFKDRTEYVIRGKNFALPEITKNGHRFLGWYTKDNEYIGMAGQVIQRVMVDNVLTAKWSEPLHYEIRFDIDEEKIQILENKVAEYQYGTVVYLPTKEQVAVADGYIFLGWYEDGDETKTLITCIDTGSFGDKRIKPLLVKASGDGNGSGGSQGGNGTGGTGSGNNQGGNGNGGNGTDGTGSGNSQGGNGTGGTGSGNNQGGNGNGGNGTGGTGSGNSQGGNGNGGNGTDGTGSGNNQGGNGTDGSGSGSNQGGNGNGGNGTDGTGSGNNQGGNGNGGNGIDGTGSGNNQGGNGTDGTGSGSNQGGNGSNGGQNGTGGVNGNGGQNGGNGTGSNGQDGGLEEKPGSGSNLDSMKQHGNQDSDIKLEKFWKKKLRYQMMRGAKGKILLKVINCRKSLKKVKIPASVRWKGNTYKVTRIGRKAFYKKGKIHSVVIGKNVRRIGKLSMAKMKRLKRVTLGKSVRTIRVKAFAKNPSLWKLIIRTKKLKMVAKNAFRQTKPKKGIQYPKGKKRVYRTRFSL